MAKKRVAILISGRGSNMEALIGASRELDYPATVCGVISNESDALGPHLAEQAGVD